MGCFFDAAGVAARDGMGETRVLVLVDDEAHGVCPGFAPIRLDDAAGNGGNSPFDEALFQLACLLTDDRDDCAVELFNFSTLEPPCAARMPLSDCSVALPGRDG